MSKWLSFLLLIVLLAIPFAAKAQGQVTLNTVTVQLWPEFDTPDLLVILDIQLASSVSLPTQLTFQLPGSVEKPYVVAVGQTAQTVSDQNVAYTYQKNGEWLDVNINASGPVIRIEYYDPNLSKEGNHRSFTYVWPGDYAVSKLGISLRIPVDTTNVTSDPQMTETIPAGDNQTYLEWDTSNLSAGQQVPVKIAYTKTSDRLGASGEPLQAGTVNENTPGRVSLNNYLPYILGSLGILFIVVGGIYFWQSGRGKRTSRKRHRPQNENDESAQVYCHQCGKRAQSNDRFCRTCGTKLRQES